MTGLRDIQMLNLRVLLHFIGTATLAYAVSRRSCRLLVFHVVTFMIDTPAMFVDLVRSSSGRCFYAGAVLYTLFHDPVTWLVLKLEICTAVITKIVVFWDIRTQFVPHGRYITSPLQRPAS
jgi:hypothetical protein